MDELLLEAEEETIITDFSYSGINETQGIGNNLNIGDQVFADQEFEFKWVPDVLKGSEYLLLPNKDANYKALDLMHFSVNTDTTLFVAHDDRLERPLWLLEEFEETEAKVPVLDHLHTLYKKDMKRDTTITLGGNVDEADAEDGNMYLVFAKEYAENLVIEPMVIR